MEIEGKTAYIATELLPHVSENWLDACEGAINGSNDADIESTPVFRNKAHLLAEICGAGVYGFVEEELTENEKAYCVEVLMVIMDNPDRKNWNIGHIKLIE